MHKPLVSGVVLLALGACGPLLADDTGAEPRCDPWEQVCEVSLHPSWETRTVLELRTARMTLEPTDAPLEALGEGRLRASISRYLALQSEVDEPLVCLIPAHFAQLRDVPVDRTACECDALVGCWSNTVLFGLVGTEGTEFEGFGMLLETSEGELYRARVLTAESGSGESTLTIEYEAVM